MTAQYRDAHDFIRMVKQNPDYDKDKPAELGALLYPECGRDVLELARKAGAGQTFNL
jgi:5,10-methylenetetrahydrofolate reductase